jgi:hypothetical protein
MIKKVYYDDDNLEQIFESIKEGVLESPNSEK